MRALTITRGGEIRAPEPEDFLCSTGIEIAVIGLAVASAAATAISAEQQARAANASANLQRFQSRQAAVQGVIEGNAILRNANDTEAANLARFGAAGFALGEGGAPEQVNAAVRRDADYNLSISRGNASNASQFLSLQASQEAMRARYTRVAGFTRAAGSLARTGVGLYG